MRKNYTILAFALCFALSIATAQKPPSTKQFSADKSEPTTNNIIKFDQEPPVLNCFPNIISVNIMPTGMISMWAADFLNSASDNITPFDQLRFGIREVGTGSGFPFQSFGVPQSQRIFDCTEQGQHDLEIWAMDLAGNTSHCISGVTIVDGNNNCSGVPGLGLIKLRITAGPEEDGVVATVEVNGVDSLGIPFQFDLGENNCSFMVPLGSSGTITVTKDDNPTNGVTVSDIIIIDNHTSGTALMTNPYYIIAADINHDGILNPPDTMELRRLVMGFDQDFQHNTAWRFVDKSYVFQDPQNPLQEPFPETFSFTNIQGILEFHIEGIKVGDVNGTAVGNSLVHAGDGKLRNDDAGSILAEGTMPPLDTGIVKLDQEPPIYGTGHLCVEQCDLLGIEEVQLAIYKDSISYFDMSANDGCWDFPNSLPIDSSFILAPHKDDNPLNGINGEDMLLLSRHINGTQPFTEPWQFVAADANKDNVIDLQDSIAFIGLIMGIYPELPYNASWRFVRSNYIFPWPDPLSQPFPETITVGELVDSVEVVFLGIKIGDLTMNCFGQSPVSEPGTGSLFSASIFPNPTSAGTTLSIQLARSEAVQLEIRDVSGRLVFEDKWQLSAGAQSLEIPASALPSPGLFIWNLRAGGAMGSGKVIRL